MSLVQVRKSSRKKKKTSKIVEMAIDDEDQVVALKAKRARKRKSKESTNFDEAEMDVQKTSNIVQSLSNDFDTITPTNIMCKPVSSSRSDARKRKGEGRLQMRQVRSAEERVTCVRFVLCTQRWEHNVI